MQKLMYPVQFIGIKTYYSQRHQGLDLGWHDKQHEPIYACADGKVTDIFQDDACGGGLSLEITYDNGFKSVFKHLSENLVKVGDRVVQGQQVSIMGDSGWACDGFHLHYNLYQGNVRVNPINYTYVYPNQQVSDTCKDDVLYYTPEPEPTPSEKLNIGDKVIINGYLYTTAYDNEPAGRVIDKETILTRICENSPHPYNTTGDLGWMDKDSVRKYGEAPKDMICVGDWVVPIEKVDYYGTPVAQYDDKYKVTELNGNRAVLSAERDGQLVTWCAMDVNNLKKC